MRVAAVVLLFAVLCLTASSVAWWRATAAQPTIPEGATPAALLASFEETSAPEATIDLASRYAGRLELLDPRAALPAWHKLARDQAVVTFTATKTCPVAAGAGIVDASLLKAHTWASETCAGAGPSLEQLVARAPFMHPSGRSYAALARGLPASPGTTPAAVPAMSREWARAHVRSFHVLELAALDVASLDRDDRALASIPSEAWESLTRGDRVVLTRGSLLVAEHGSLGLTKLRVYPRRAWETFVRAAPFALAPRATSALCARPASQDLCWEPRSVADRHRPALLFGTGASAALVLAASFALGFAYIGERRRIHGDRIHVLRTLTHELRTPATSLRLDIEPLRAAYDELPVSCQEPLLRISDGIERLHRVLHRSARYMALFETSETGGSSVSLVKIAEVPSVKDLFEELSEEWPEGVALTAPPEDVAIRVDPEWLGVAVRNLVENGVRHGKPPVAVAWRIDAGDLVVSVADGGSSASLSLRRAIAPNERDPKSPGLGLGLAIVDRVARLLGGKLSHEPSPTMFELRIPAKRHKAEKAGES